MRIEEARAISSILRPICGKSVPVALEDTQTVEIPSGASATVDCLIRASTEQEEIRCFLITGGTCPSTRNISIETLPMNKIRPLLE